MLTSVYMELFPDNWTYGFTAEQIHALNRMWWPSVIVIPDHEKYGFDSAFDAFQNGMCFTENQFEFTLNVIIGPQATKMYREIAEIMENSDDPYVLEVFFYLLEN